VLKQKLEKILANASTQACSDPRQLDGTIVPRQYCSIEQQLSKSDDYTNYPSLVSKSDFYDNYL